MRIVDVFRHVHELEELKLNPFGSMMKLLKMVIFHSKLWKLPEGTRPGKLTVCYGSHGPNRNS